MKILMILTSHSELGDSRHKTGFWAEEFAAPYYAFKDAGAEITLASPNGGQPPIDPNSQQADAQTNATVRLFEDESALDQLATTLKLTEVNANEFDAVFYPGGHGPLWDLVDNQESIG
ncbi:type 1 glutamine amidotransferase domain-containing protein, partial [Pseudidiomarina aestuarii]